MPHNEAMGWRWQNAQPTSPSQKLHVDFCPSVRIQGQLCCLIFFPLSQATVDSWHQGVIGGGGTQVSSCMQLAELPGAREAC